MNSLNKVELYDQNVLRFNVYTVKVDDVSIVLTEAYLIYLMIYVIYKGIQLHIQSFTALGVMLIWENC